MFTLADRVQETCAAPGTGIVTLLGAVTEYQSFSAGIGANNTTYYTIADQTGSNWEVGLGTIDATGLTLTRTTILASSNAGSVVNFSVGTQNIWCDYPAGKAVYGTGTTLVAPSGTILPVLNGGSGVTTSTGSGSVVLSAAPSLTGAVTIGTTSDTGTITVGQSTVSQTINISNGATASGSTKTVNIGTGGLTGSTTTMAIGSTFSTTVAANGTWSFSTPLVATNMVQATTSTSGYLTSTDWNTFNGKYSTGGALGTPSSGTVTNLTGTASININGTVGATTPSTVAATSITAPIVKSATTLQLQTNGYTTAVTIDASQNVGIGTSSPSKKLEVYAAANSLQIETVIRNDQSGTGVAAIGFNVSSSASSETTSTKAGIGLQRGSPFGGGALCFYNNNSGTSGDFTTADEKMRIDASGNVGIGTASPATFGKFVVINNTNVGSEIGIATTSGGSVSGSHTSILRLGAFSANGFLGCDIAAITDYSNTTGTALTFGTVSAGSPTTTSPTERMRIDSSGNVLVGCTAVPSASVNGLRLGAVGNNYWISSTSLTTSFGHMLFYNANGLVGSINTSGTATSYVTSSDYRLKENVAPMVGALETIAQLKPVTYDWKSDKSKGQGFIAHELQAVVPDCVTGEKDAIDADGNPQYQGIDTSFLVATLTCAIQELKAIIDLQQTQITALNAKVGI